MFLDSNEKISTKKFCSFSSGQARICRRILLSNRVYQNDKEGMKQFYTVADFDEDKNNGKFIKWSDETG